MNFVPELLWPVIAYLFGSISCAVVVAKVLGLEDPREAGSGNPGATNVLRTGGKKAAILTLIGDVAKGAIPVVLASQAGVGNGVLACVAIGAFMGHLYPIFFGFKGGKGVATAIGVIGALSWVLLAVFVAVWALTAIVSRYSSLASLLATSAVAVASFAVFNDPQELQLIGATFWIFAFTFQRHRDNIVRLRSGQETKIGEKSET